MNNNDELKMKANNTSTKEETGKNTEKADTELSSEELGKVSGGGNVNLMAERKKDDR